MTLTTQHPGASIICVLLLASTVDWMADVLFGMF